MKPPPSPREGMKSRLPRGTAHLVTAIVVLILTVALSVASGSHIRSIFPYALAVGLMAWRHGMGAGFLFAGLATLAALAAGAFPSREELEGQEVGEGLFTYLKLSAVAVGVALGKRARRADRSP